MKLYGVGFKAGSQVRIVFDTPRRVVVGSARADPDGTFRASIVVPRAGAGAHRIQAVGTGPSGRPMSLAVPVIVLTEQPSIVTATPSPSLAEPVLLTLAIVVPLTTWLTLEMLGWRHRRLDKRGGRG